MTHGDCEIFNTFRWHTTGFKEAYIHHYPLKRYLLNSFLLLTMCQISFLPHVFSLLPFFLPLRSRCYILLFLLLICSSTPRICHNKLHIFGRECAVGYKMCSFVFLLARSTCAKQLRDQNPKTLSISH